MKNEQQFWKFYWVSLLVVGFFIWSGGQTQVRSVISECRSLTGYKITR